MEGTDRTVAALVWYELLQKLGRIGVEERSECPWMMFSKLIEVWLMLRGQEATDGQG